MLPLPRTEAEAGAGNGFAGRAGIAEAGHKMLHGSAIERHRPVTGEYEFRQDIRREVAGEENSEAAGMIQVPLGARRIFDEELHAGPAWVANVISVAAHPSEELAPVRHERGRFRAAHALCAVERADS